MKLSEAYTILGVPSTVSPEEAKKQYKKMTKEFHPDINKEPGAEDKFKKINEAYQVISSGKSSDREMPAPSQNHSWNPFGRQSFVKEISNIELSATISFKESILGAKVEIKYKRNIKCQSCNGNGEITINNGCDKCKGRGQIITQQGNMIFTQTCDKCFGRMQTETCKVCKSEGLLESESSVDVTIPGGIKDSQILRLQQMGNFAGSFGPMDQYTDVHLCVKVIPETGLSLDKNDVVSILEISLLEALRGCNKTVKTILGDKEISIKPKSRNKEEIIIPKFGVNKIGSHKVILDVSYPTDINKLVDVLT